MAGHQHRHTIRGARAGHGTRRLWRTQRIGKFRVTASLSGRDFHQCIPYPFLEGSAYQVQRQVGSLAGKALGHGMQAWGKEFITACLHVLDVRIGKFMVKLAFQLRSVFTQLDRTDAAPGRSDQGVAQHGFHK